MGWLKWESGTSVEPESAGMTKEREIGMLQNNPEKDPLTEKLIDSGIAYKGSFLQVHKDTVKTPDGVVTTREYLHHPGASMIIPMFEDGTVILERQYRHPLRRSFLEFPAGKLNPGESPFNCAKRELTEETGYEAKVWKKLGRFNNAITVFYAGDLQYVGQNLDAGEVLDIIKVSFSEVLEQCLNGEITDVKTIVGAFWLENFLKTQKKSK